MTSALIDAATFAELQAYAGAEFVVEPVQTFVDESAGLVAELRGGLDIDRASS
jgi:hypothetical protein